MSDCVSHCARRGGLPLLYKRFGKKEAGASDSFFVARKEPGDLEPTVEHVQVGKEAM
jgi:hypothetical protein